jgi:hypothetical protein
MKKHHHPENDADAAQLAAMGHRAELNRNFSSIAMLGLAFAILNSWTALASSLSLALPSGGPTSVLWGLVGKYPLIHEFVLQILTEFQPLVSAISRLPHPSPNFSPHIPLPEGNTTGSQLSVGRNGCRF